MAQWTKMFAKETWSPEFSLWNPQWRKTTSFKSCSLTSPSHIHQTHSFIKDFYVYFTCTQLCETHERLLPEDHVRSSETGVVSGCELPCEFWAWVLTTKPSLSLSNIKDCQGARPLAEPQTASCSAHLCRQLAFLGDFILQSLRSDLSPG